MPLGQRFDAQKATEAVLFIAHRVDEPTFHRIAKLLYLADLKKLEKYGSLVVGDRYIKMEYGPVPSGTYNLLKGARGDGDRAMSELAADAFEVDADGKTVRPLREPNLDLFSEADLEVLEASINEFGKASFNDLVGKSHDAAWRAASMGKPIELKAIAAVAGDSDVVDFVNEWARQAS